MYKSPAEWLQIPPRATERSHSNAPTPRLTSAPNGVRLEHRTLCDAVGTPCLHLSAERVESQTATELLREFILRRRVKRLNIAGPRASEEPAAADYAHRVLVATWRGELPAGRRFTGGNEECA
jgi:hypothetical protein